MLIIMLTEISFQKVKDIYESVEVTKFECIGHYQKRVGNWLRKLKTNNKGLGGRNKKRAVNKTGTGKAKEKVEEKSRLTDPIIDKLQNYFGIALRSNIGNLEKMKGAILASLFHVASSSFSIHHDYCPKSSDSWCQY